MMSMKNLVLSKYRAPTSYLCRATLPSSWRPRNVFYFRLVNLPHGCHPDHLQNWLLNFLQNWLFRRIVYDRSVSYDLDAISVPALLLIPSVGATIDILADRSNRLPDHIVDLLGVQATNLEILHYVLLCES